MHLIDYKPLAKHGNANSASANQNSVKLPIPLRPIPTAFSTAKPLPYLYIAFSTMPPFSSILEGTVLSPYILKGKNVTKWQRRMRKSSPRRLGIDS